MENVKKLIVIPTYNEVKNIKELLQDIYIKTAENVCKSESLRTEISKDDFSDKDKVIDTLLYTVGLLTKDVLFYQSNVSKLKGHKPIYKA